jgi:predicted acylesterase/phospholipase RssA
MENEPMREVRIALVLYGGVSLAIYENGVTQCFYDLVKERGVFRILLDLLDTKATVDVIAGTSAGGINGLFWEQR